MATETRPRLRADGFSLWTGVTHFAVMSIFVALGLTLGQQPGPMHPTMLLPFFYILFSPLIAFGGALAGLIESFTAPRRRAVIGFALNAVYLVGLGAFVVHMWDAWMGI